MPPSESPSSKNRFDVLISIKDYAFFAPIIGGGLAIAYDLGFFYGLNSGFFSAFSLSEHLVFALEALPMAIIFLALGAVEWTAIFGAKTGKRYNKSLTLVILNALLVLILLFEVWQRDYFIALCIGTILASFIPNYFLEPPQNSQFALLFSTPILGLCLSFILGLVTAHITLSGAQNKETKISLQDGTALLGEFLRSGERGVLLFEADSHSFALVPWSKIARIENSRKSP